MSVRIKIFVSALLAGILCTCTYRTNDPNICFTENVLPIITSNCGGCHGNLTNYEGIMRYVTKNHPLQSDLYSKIKGANPSMPPTGKLTSQQVYIIKTWISMGAQNSSNCTSCDTSQYKFAANIQPILNNWCINCHTSSNAGGGYDLTNYAGVSSAVTSGKLIGSIKHLPGYFAMPQSGQLPSCEINKIQNWVNAGHPNN